MKALMSFLFAAVLCGSAWAAPVKIFTGDSGVAIDGYDPVAYFTDGKPVKGLAEFSHEWSGVRWQFANAEHRDRFKKNPDQFAPQYGGYCAFAASINSVADGDPDYWKIHDGKLYLNKNWIAEKLWLRDIPANVKDGDQHWPALAAGIGKPSQ